MVDAVQTGSHLRVAGQQVLVILVERRKASERLEMGDIMVLTQLTTLSGCITSSGPNDFESSESVMFAQSALISLRKVARTNVTLKPNLIY